jgi:hypothetical protein
MTSHADRKRSSNPLLGLLLGLAIGGSVVLGQNLWVPAWLGAAVSGLGLLGALIVLSHQGAVKARYIVLLVGTILAAALAGWLLQ